MGRAKASKADERWYISFLFSKLAGGASAPLVPLFVITVLGGGVGEVTLAVVSVSVATVPAFVLWGEYTDKRGKRKLPIVVGTALMAVAFVVMTVSRDMPTFILGNVLYGFFLAATVPSSTILIMERNPEPEWGRAVGRFSKVSGIGWMLGMVLGAVFFAIAPPFVGGMVMAMHVFMGLCAAFSVVATVMAIAWIDEPTVRIDRRWLSEEVIGLRTWAFERARHIPSKIVFNLRPRIIRKARNFLPGWGRSLDIYLVSTFVLFTGIQVFYVPFPVMLSEELGLDSARIFAVYLTASLAAAAMYVWAGREVDRLGNRKSQLIAWGSRSILFPAFAVTLLLMGWGYPLVAFGLAAALNGAIGGLFAIVSVAGVTTALDLAPNRGRGEAVGAYNAVTGLGMIAGGLLGGLVAATLGYYAVAILTGVLGAVAIGLLLKVRFKSSEAS
jgi:MFS family permease